MIALHSILTMFVATKFTFELTSDKEFTYDIHSVKREALLFQLSPGGMSEAKT